MHFGTEPPERGRTPREGAYPETTGYTNPGAKTCHAAAYPNPALPGRAESARGTKLGTGTPTEELFLEMDESSALEAAGYTDNGGTRPEEFLERSRACRADEARQIQAEAPMQEPSPEKQPSGTPLEEGPHNTATTTAKGRCPLPWT